MQLHSKRSQSNVASLRNFEDSISTNNDELRSKTTRLTKHSPVIDYLIKRRMSNCILGTSSHIAVLFPTELNLKKVVIGENSERITYGNKFINRHAEIDALQRILFLLRCKKIKKNKMNLLVLRVNKSGNLCESAPCFHCTMFLKKNNDILINKLYFSRGDGSIQCMKFSDWCSHGNMHVSKGWHFLSKQNKERS